MKTALFAIILFMSMTGWCFPQERFPRIRVSADIELVKVTENVYVHVSTGEMPPWGKVSSNGVIFRSGREALLLDTPINDSLTRVLVEWVEDSLHVRIIGFVPNHSHIDCMGGLRYVHSRGIPSYAHEKTISIATARNLPIPQHSFADSLTLRVGTERVVCRYFGAGHTVDNIVCWMPSERVLFGGCMVKDIASKPNLWIAIARSAQIIVPGHGAIGGQDLLVHTRSLLLKQR